MKGRKNPIEILIAEDSPTQAEQLQMLLEENGFRVIKTPNGRAALDQLADSRPALVISDVVMPELNGYGLCRAIKADPKLQHIPVMLVTTLSDPVDVIRGLECGADNFIRKPYDENDLLSRINYLLMNVELRNKSPIQMSLEIDIGGNKYAINSDRQQILHMLISTYEQAVDLNGELKAREQELARSNRVLQQLNRIAEGLNEAVSEKQVVEVALRHALSLPGVEAGWIFLREGESEYRLAGAAGLPPELAGLNTLAGGCSCQQKLTCGTLDSATNILQCDRLARATNQPQGMNCHASVPLRLGEKEFLGVLNLIGPDKGAFTDEDLALLSNIGHQVAVALERARLHEDLEAQVRDRTAKLTAEIEERKRIERAQARLVAIIEATPDLIGIANLDGQVIYVNQAGLRMTGYKQEEIAAARSSQGYPEWSNRLVREVGIPAAIKHGHWVGESAILSADGTEIPVHQMILSHKDEHGKPAYISTIARDITELKANEARIARLNRIYAVLSGINTSIVHIQDKDELFSEACRIAVEEGKFRFAWIGRLDADSRWVTPIAQAGHNDGYLEQVDLTAEPGVAERYQLIQQALSNQAPVICNDIAADERTRPWRELALARGYRAVTVFPLMLGGRPYGVLVLYSGEQNVFDDEELKLLLELSSDISYALDKFDLEARRLQAEAELRKLSLVVEQSPSSVLIADLQANIEYVNEGFVRLTGYSREEVVGQKLKSLGSAKLPSETYRDKWSRLNRGEAWRGELVNRRKDGSEYVESIVASPLRDADGQISHFLTISEDITDRKRAEAAVRESRESLHRLLNSMYEGVYGLDIDGKCTFVNQSFLQMLGYQDESEVLGREIHTLVHHSHADGTPFPLEQCPIHKACQGSQSINVSDEVFWRKDGVSIPVEYWAHPIITDGKMTGAITTFIDITERKQSEARLLELNESLEQRVRDRTTDLEHARREADQANRAKSAFLATMSHEIRTPMNGVIGMVGVLEQSELSAHQADLVGTIRDSASALLGIIDDILDFSKIEAGRMELEREPICLEELIEGLSNSLVPVAARKNVDLSLFVSPDVPVWVLSDDVRLRQLFYNLVGNAIKFSAGRPGKRGQVTIRVEVAQAEPLRLKCSIADNGIGMSPETIRGLFTPFTQAEVSTTRHFGGTGLGLAICKRLVDLMEGEITVESTLGAGSLFSFTLPFDVAPDQASRNQPDITGLYCLLVESSDLNSADLRSYLEHAGARVHLISDPAAVTAILTALATPAVILLTATQVPQYQGELENRPDVRRLVITRGRRRRARVESEDTVTLDGDAMRRLTLLRAVAVAAGRASPDIIHERTEETRIGEDTPPPTISEARARDQLILVAEDDDINQKVILQQLSLLGYAAEIAGNGAEALRMWREGHYALLLTDLHMPEMDGYSLTEAIRQEEEEDRHMPIMALTANALRGEANRAYEVGMDEYLTKPVKLPALRAMLEKWLHHDTAQTGPDQHQEAPAATDRAVLDVTVLQELVGADPEIVQEFLSDYLSSARKLAVDMDAALSEGDMPHIRAVAHKLKSSSRSVGALPLGDICAELENTCRIGNKSAIPEAVQAVRNQLAQVENEVTRYLAASSEHLEKER